MNILSMKLMLVGTYSNFNKYVNTKDLKPQKNEKGHPRYETDMVIQAQVDWKETDM